MTLNRKFAKIPFENIRRDMDSRAVAKVGDNQPLQWELPNSRAVYRTKNSELPILPHLADRA